jgi:hypothetical protein
MSIQLIQQYRAKVEQMIRYGGSRNESTLRKPFQDLLEQYARSKNLLEWLEKIKTCRSLGADRLDLAAIHPNQIKLLARRARQKSNLALAKTEATERHALLACFLF